jgi:hypothetical protein
LNGDSEYRNEATEDHSLNRGGPLAVKSLPAKKITIELCITASELAAIRPETTNRDESCAQLSGNSGLCFDQSRTLACIIKRNLQYLSVDMAIVIGQPRGKKGRT